MRILRVSQLNQLNLNDLMNIKDINNANNLETLHDAIKTNNLDILDSILFNINFNINNEINYNTIKYSLKTLNPEILFRIFEISNNIIDIIDMDIIQECINTNSLALVNIMLNVNGIFNKFNYLEIIQMLMTNEYLFINEINNKDLLIILKKFKYTESYLHLKYKIHQVFKFYKKYLKYKMRFIQVKRLDN
jgi:hypothetical protein